MKLNQIIKHNEVILQANIVLKSGAKKGEREENHFAQLGSASSLLQQ